jgi:hypothetical protein
VNWNCIVMKSKEWATALLTFIKLFLTLLQILCTKLRLLSKLQQYRWQQGSLSFLYRLEHCLLLRCSVMAACTIPKNVALVPSVQRVKTSSPLPLAHSSPVTWHHSYFTDGKTEVQRSGDLRSLPPNPYSSQHRWPIFCSLNLGGHFLGARHWDTKRNYL